jgi:hypothetical protein
LEAKVARKKISSCSGRLKGSSVALRACPGTKNIPCGAVDALRVPSFPSRSALGVHPTDLEWNELKLNSVVLSTIARTENSSFKRVLISPCFRRHFLECSTIYFSMVIFAFKG